MLKYKHPASDEVDLEYHLVRDAVDILCIDLEGAVEHTL